MLPGILLTASSMIEEVKTRWGVVGVTVLCDVMMPSRYGCFEFIVTVDTATGPAAKISYNDPAMHNEEQSCF